MASARCDSLILTMLTATGSAPGTPAGKSPHIHMTTAVIYLASPILAGHVTAMTYDELNNHEFEDNHNNLGV